MEKSRLKFIKDIGKILCNAEGKVLYWKMLKEHYLTLTDDEEKNKVLAMIFKDKEKEG